MEHYWKEPVGLKSRKKSSNLKSVISTSMTPMAGIICSLSQLSIITVSIRKSTTSRFISGVVNTITPGVHKCGMHWTRSMVINIRSIITSILLTRNISVESLSVLRLRGKSSKPTTSGMCIRNSTHTTRNSHGNSN